MEQATGSGPKGYSVTSETAEYAEWPTKGHEYWFKATLELTGGVFSLTESRSSRGAVVAPHVHDVHDEGQYVLEGEYRFTIEDVEHVARAGDFVFVPRGVVHSFAVGDEGGRCLTFFVPGGYEAVFRDVAVEIANGHVHEWEWGHIAREHGTRFLIPDKKPGAGGPPGKGGGPPS